MPTCQVCGVESKRIAKALALCPSCAREGGEAVKIALEAHARVRRSLGLPEVVPKDPNGARCNWCSNECYIPEGGVGYCGLRRNEGGRLVHLAGLDVGLLYAYYDPLPTNCCAAWFCLGTRKRGYNLAVFFYGCNFDCLYCQNISHKRLVEGLTATPRELAERARPTSVKCICYFGGSPEPQLPFALRASREALELASKRGEPLHVCWEWNGCGSGPLVDEAARLSLTSGGNVKFDLKAWSPALSIALSGVENKRAYENFQRLAKTLHPQRLEEPLLTATTLLVPYYVDEVEVEAIASFIANLDPSIPYSLLIFYGAHAMRDLPITPVDQVVACYRAAERHLERVHVGNLHLIGLRSMAEFRARLL
ncbi:MAG: radical SAM protein [Candidatus Nezhaarchaeota archaeon]|nr:radical SAM protein [Candidatus Nezhaarchaeota archaeon]